MAAIPVGLKGEERILVTSEYAVDFLGVDEARVLGTPHLIAWLEMTARNSIKPLLDAGFDSVGTEVCIKHLAASPMGMAVRFTSEVIDVQERRVKFRVEAHDEKEKIAEGTHERFVINIGKFATRWQAKKLS